MKAEARLLLLIDAIINLLLGIALLLYPGGIADVLGLPPFSTAFYPTVLGAVLVGIGIALLLERYGKQRGIRGLGIGGAIAINLCGATALLAWLVGGALTIPARGRVLLWTVGIAVMLLALWEAALGSRREQGCDG